MENKIYIIAHGYGEDFSIDGVCDTAEEANKLCAVYNDSTWKNGKCYTERRVLPINRFYQTVPDDRPLVYRVSVQFKAKRNRSLQGKVARGIDSGICYFSGSRTKPSVTQADKAWTVDLFVPAGTTQDEMVQMAKEALDEHLAAQV